jgi:hypothetical protein
MRGTDDYATFSLLLQKYIVITFVFIVPYNQRVALQVICSCLESFLGNGETRGKNGEGTGEFYWVWQFSHSCRAHYYFCYLLIYGQLSSHKLTAADQREATINRISLLVVAIDSVMSRYTATWNYMQLYISRTYLKVSDLCLLTLLFFTIL